MNSTSWFVAVAGFAAAAMTLWILLDWVDRAGERPFRPRRDSEAPNAERNSSQIPVQVDDADAKTRSTPGRKRSEEAQHRSEGRPDEVPADAEIDFAYIDALAGAAATRSADAAESDELTRSSDQDESDARSTVRRPQVES